MKFDDDRNRYLFSSFNKRDNRKKTYHGEISFLHKLFGIFCIDADSITKSYWFAEIYDVCSSTITKLVRAWNTGDETALGKLIPMAEREFGCFVSEAIVCSRGKPQYI